MSSPELKSSPEPVILLSAGIVNNRVSSTWQFYSGTVEPVVVTHKAANEDPNAGSVVE